MKKRSIFILSCFAIVMLQSCTFNIVGFRSGYKNLSDVDKEKIFFLEPNAEICDIKNDGKIYGITGKQLLECIETKENVMVYFWKPYCSSEFCYPLIHVQKYCDTHGIILYAITAEYYSSGMFTQLENISQPLFSINEHFYQTKKQNKYHKLFVGDLLNDENLTKEIWWHTSFVFNYGKLVDSRIKMEEDNSGELKTIEF